MVNSIKECEQLKELLIRVHREVVSHSSTEITTNNNQCENYNLTRDAQ